MPDLNLIPLGLLTTAALDGIAIILSGTQNLSTQAEDTQVLWDAIGHIDATRHPLIKERSMLHRWVILDCIRACDLYEQPANSDSWDSRRTYLNTAQNWVLHPCFQTCKNARMHQHSGQWDVRHTNRAICTKREVLLDQALFVHENAPTPWDSTASRQRALKRIQILFAIQDRLPDPAPLIVLK